MVIGIYDYLILGSLLFFIGLYGVFSSRANVIRILMSIELMLLSVNINFVGFSAFNNNLGGQIFTLFTLTIAAAEAAVGLSILVVYYRNRNNISAADASTLRG